MQTGQIDPTHVGMGLSVFQTRGPSPRSSYLTQQLNELHLGLLYTKSPSLAHHFQHRRGQVIVRNSHGDPKLGMAYHVGPTWKYANLSSLKGIPKSYLSAKRSFMITKGIILTDLKLTKIQHLENVLPVSNLHDQLVKHLE